MTKKRRPPRIGICTYCHATTRLTNDHVPPRNLFPSGTTGIVKVPACEPCNNGAKKDDEYFRLSISVSHDPHAAPQGADVTLAAIERLKDPRKTGLRKRMLSQIRGQWMEVDTVRIHSVLRRIVKGLYFHRKGERLPPSFKVEVFSFRDFYRLPDSEVRTLVLHALSAVSEHRVGDHVFAYRYVSAAEGTSHSAWYLRFFNSVEFIALTGQRTYPKP